MTRDQAPPAPASRTARGFSSSSARPSASATPRSASRAAARSPCTTSASCRRDCTRLHETARDWRRSHAPPRRRAGEIARDCTRLHEIARGCRRLCLLQALIEAGTMPRIVSGTSGGAIVAGVLAVNTDQEGASRAPARATESSTLSSLLVDARRRCCRTLSSATSPSATCPTAGSRRCRSCSTTLWCSAPSSTAL